MRRTTVQAERGDIVSIKTTVSQDFKDLNDIVQNNVLDDELGTFAAATWHRLYTPYVPMDSGMLAQDVRISPWEIVHNVPYAGRQYRGITHDFRRNKHPLASAQWDQAAMPAKLGTLNRTLTEYLATRRRK
jgi:hypothetical protein